MNRPILLGLGALLWAFALFAAINRDFALAAILAAFGGAAFAWAAKVARKGD